MANQLEIRDLGPFIAVADLSANQYYLVKQTTTAWQVNLCTATTDAILGVLCNKPTLGHQCQIRTLGIAKVAAGGAITAGDRVGVDATGRAVTIAHASGLPVLGIANDTVSGAGLIVSVTLGISNP